LTLAEFTIIASCYSYISLYPHFALVTVHCNNNLLQEQSIEIVSKQNLISKSYSGV